MLLLQLLTYGLFITLFGLSIWLGYQVITRA